MRNLISVWKPSNVPLSALKRNKSINESKKL